MMASGMTGKRPNILLVVSDQQGASMMRCAGTRHLRTPAMDRIAGQGLRFTQAWCSNPMCLPSRFSLVTGRMGGEFGILHNDDGPDAEIPDEIRQGALGWQLRRAGYRTLWGGKEHLPACWTPEDLGFETFCRDDRDELAGSCAEVLRGPHERPFCLVACFINPHDICYMAIRDFADEERRRQLERHSSDELRELDAALAIPPGMARDEFFAWHCPPLPDNFDIPPEEPEAISRMQARSPFKRLARERYDEERWRLHRHAYARLTERVDGQVGRILEALEGSGAAEETLVIFTSDHGDMDASHRMEHKTAFYNEAARAPLLIAGPGVRRRGALENRPVSIGLDLLPTICDAAGVAPPPDLRGRSLRPLLEGRADVSWRELVPVESEFGRMVTDGRHKYMLYNEGSGREQLVDLAADPGEMHNALGDPQYQELLKGLRHGLEEALPEREASGKSLENTGVTSIRS